MSIEVTPIGTRVVAVSHSEGLKLFVFGRGVFEGYFLPPTINLPESIAKFQQQYVVQASMTPDLPPTFSEDEARKAIILSQSNPRIKLTETLDGQPLDESVWGYECWWAPEDIFTAKSAKYEIIPITVAEHRAEVERVQKEEEAEAAQLEAAILSMSGVMQGHTHES
jgi:hypothetical protein